MKLGLRALLSWKPWAVLAALVASYAALGFFAVPALLDKVLTDQVASRYGRALGIGEIRFNPFSLRLEIAGLSLPDADGAPMLGFDGLVVDVQVSSLWRRALVLREVGLAKPRLRAETRADGRFNLADLLPPETDDEPPTPVLIEVLGVVDGEVSLADLSMAQPFHATLRPIRFTLLNFSTRGAGDNAADLVAESLAGERFEWHGRIDIAPFRSKGTVEINSLRASTVLSVLEDPLPFEIGNGSIDLRADYTLAAASPLQLEVTLPELALTGFALRPRGEAADLVDLPRVVVNDLRLSLAQRSVNVARISLAGVKVAAERGTDGRLNLERLNLTRLAGTAGDAPPPGAAGPAPWTLAVASIALSDSTVAAVDQAVSPAVALTLSPLSAEVSGWSTVPGKSVQLRADAGIDGGGRLSAEGVVALDDLATQLGVRLERLTLPRFQPYVAQLSGLGLMEGSLDLSGKLATGGDAGLTFAGEAAVERLRVIDRRLKEELLSWQRLDLRGLSYRATPATLTIDEVLARKPFARVLIAADGKLNLAEALRAPGSAADDPLPPTAGTQGAAAVTAAAASPPLAARISRVRVIDGTAAFADLSLTPNFQASIQALNGTVVGLSSDPGQRATVDLKGQVDRYSPVLISGEVNYLAASAYTDLALSFRNMELTTFNPYSVKWAGYRIAKGKLTTELRYKVVDRQLDAQHKVVIDQLEFGERTNSPDAITLPLKLAVALLKDRHGVIDLDLPVSGSLDDPTFRIGPVIWKVVTNLLVKIVTAPFALLGALFGGGPDINLIDFAAGSAVLDDAAQAKLATVAKGLAERPQLKLEVPLALTPTLDRPALAAAKFEAQLATVAAASGIKAGAEPETRLRSLEAWYRADFDKKPEVPLPPGDDAKAAREQAAQPAWRIAWLEEQLRPKVSVGDAELQALAKSRSDAVLAMLLANPEIDPVRVFVTATPPAAAEAAAVRMELKLE